MTDIRRYTLDHDDDRALRSLMLVRPDGKYVLHSEHTAQITTLRLELLSALGEAGANLDRAVKAEAAYQRKVAQKNKDFPNGF